MLTKIKIENFMSHKNTEIEFSPTTNAIVGQNDSGKSAVFHAIRWLTLDSPKGDSVIRDGHDICKVTIYTSLGVISKQRKLNGGTSWETFVAAKNSRNSYNTAAQPPELEQIIKLSDVSFSMQHDTPYLIGASGSDAADLLGSVSGVDVIDTAIDIVSKQLNNAATTLKMQESLLKSASDKVELLSAVKDVKLKFIKLVESEDANRLKTITHDKFVELLDKNRDLVRQIVKHESYVKILYNVELLQRAMDANNDFALKVEKLVNVLESFNSIEATLAFSREEVAVLNKVHRDNCTELEDSYSVLVALKANLKQLRSIEAAANSAELKQSTLENTKSLFEAVEQLSLQKHKAFIEIKEKLLHIDAMKRGVNAVAEKLNNLEKMNMGITDLSKTQEARDVLKELLVEYNKAKGVVITMEDALKTTLAKLSSIHKELHNIDGQICPTCGGELKLSQVLK